MALEILGYTQNSQLFRPLLMQLKKVGRPHIGYKWSLLHFKELDFTNNRSVRNLFSHF